MATKTIRKDTKKNRPGPEPRWPERVDASIPPEVKESLISESERQGMSVSAIVRQILTSWYADRV